jgi:choline dehydrogenase
MFNFGQCRPDSRGELRLRSSDATVRPLIRANYLTAPTDQRVMLEAARVGQRIGATAPFSDLVVEALWPAGPPRTDDEMLDFIRSTGTTVYHPCGTCRMGSDEGAVVDPSLRVRGVDGLRVADASVFPLVPSSNIQPAVMMVAERGAAMVQADGAARVAA